MAIKTGTARSSAIKGGNGGTRLRHINKLASTPNARGHSTRTQGLSGARAKAITPAGGGEGTRGKG